MSMYRTGGGSNPSFTVIEGQMYVYTTKHTVDMSQYATNYKNLVLGESLFLVVTRCDSRPGAWSIDYNAETGILSCSASTQFTIAADVYYDENA